MASFFRAVVVVVNAVSIGAWGWTVATSKHHHAINTWLVIALAILATSALLWGWEGRRKYQEGGVQHHHYYSAPVTWNVGPDGTHIADARKEEREVVGPARPARKPEIVRLADYVEFPEKGPPVIRNRVFRNAVLRGPILLALTEGSADFVRVKFEAARDDPWSMLWPVYPGHKKVAVAALENCVFEDCSTEQVGFVGTRDQLEDFKNQIKWEWDS